MFKMLFYALGIYFLYRLIFNFIIPVTKATSTIKKNMQAMQQQMHAQQQYNNAQQAPVTAPSKPKAAKDDYIDFEEVK